MGGAPRCSLRSLKVRSYRYAIATLSLRYRYAIAVVALWHAVCIRSVSKKRRVVTFRCSCSCRCSGSLCARAPAGALPPVGGGSLCGHFPSLSSFVISSCIRSTTLAPTSMIYANMCCQAHLQLNQMKQNRGRSWPFDPLLLLKMIRIAR